MLKYAAPKAKGEIVWIIFLFSKKNQNAIVYYLKFII